MALPVYARPGEATGFAPALTAEDLLSTPPEVCPVCDSRVATELVTIPEMPIHIGILWPSPEAARGCPRGDLRFVYCGNCTHIWNTAFDPALMEYDEQYDNSLEGSPRFRQYAESLAQRLIDRYDVRDKTVLEIGCGKGHFLALLCRLGNNRGVGFDTAYEDNPELADLEGRFEVIRDFYSEKYAHHQADLICCRHVFEHVDDPAGFLGVVRRSIGDAASVVYFEVPNALFSVRDLNVWNLIYEHYSYFSAPALEYVFNRCGFEILEIGESFDGQFLGVEARPAASAIEPRVDAAAVDPIGALEGSLATHFRQLEKEWSERLQRYAAEGRRVVVWGAGAKAVTFVNLFDTGDRFECVVDINPNKRGKHLPGSGHEVVAPEDLRGAPPEVVIIMNSIYEKEIGEQLARLGMQPELISA